MQSFGHDLHLIDRVCTITKEEATRKMHGQDWEEMREAETKYTSDEFFRFELDKLNKLINEQIQSDSITVSNETPTKKQNGKCDTLTSTKFKVTNKVGFDMVSQLYEFVNKDGWFDTNELSREDFIDLTGKADFRRFYDAEKKLRTKVRFIICQLSKRSIYPKEWFAQACKLLELDAKQMGKHDGITQQWLRRWERTFPEPKDGYFEG